MIHVPPLTSYIMCISSQMHTGFLSSHIEMSFLGNKVCMARRSVGSGEGGKGPGVMRKLKSQAGDNSLQNQIPSDFIIHPPRITSKAHPQPPPSKTVPEHLIASKPQGPISMQVCLWASPQHLEQCSPNMNMHESAGDLADLPLVSDTVGHVCVVHLHLCQDGDG